LIDKKPLTGNLSGFFDGGENRVEKTRVNPMKTEKLW